MNSPIVEVWQKEVDAALQSARLVINDVEKRAASYNGQPDGILWALLLGVAMTALSFGLFFGLGASIEAGLAMAVFVGAGGSAAGVLLSRRLERSRELLSIDSQSAKYLQAADDVERVIRRVRRSAPPAAISDLWLEHSKLMAMRTALLLGGITPSNSPHIAQTNALPVSPPTAPPVAQANALPLAGPSSHHTSND